MSPRTPTASVGAGAGTAAAEDAAAIDSVAGEAAVDDAEPGAGDADADADGAAAHGFGFAPDGGFSVTSGRHDEREAKMPW